MLPPNSIWHALNELLGDTKKGSGVETNLDIVGVLAVVDMSQSNCSVRPGMNHVAQRTHCQNYKLMGEQMLPTTLHPYVWLHQKEQTWGD